MTTAKIRRDLIERGEMPPHQHGYILKDVQYNCIQPGEIETLDSIFSAPLNQIFK